MTGEILPCLELTPREPARSSVIVLHGIGADGHDLAPAVPVLGLDDCAVRFVLPHAPRRPVTANRGLIMSAWYDIRDLDLGKDHDRKGIDESAAQLRALVAREVSRGVPSQRIVLAGFSQGGAIALHVALRHPERLAGVLALSTYLLVPDMLPEEAHEANRGIPIFQAHGTRDTVVPIVYGERARDRLRQISCPVVWRTYPVGHEVPPEGIRDIQLWLRERLA